MVRTPRPLKPILGGIVYAGHEIDSEPEVMGRLSASRFRRADREQVVLPLEAAMRLKDFEAGLRSTGLMMPDEALFQSREDDYKFRVQRTQATIDLGSAHSTISIVGHRAKALSAELFHPKPLVKGNGDRDRLGDELRALSAQRAAKPRT